MSDVLWQPTPESIRGTRIAAFASWVAERRGLSFGAPTTAGCAWPRIIGPHELTRST